MNEIIEAYNSLLAFGILLVNNENIKYNSFIDITKQIKSGKNEKDYHGLGLLFCYEISELGANDNKVQFRIKDNVQPGTKTWETKYKLVPHVPNFNKHIVINDIAYYDLKKDAEDAAKIWCVENKIDVHIITTKVIKDADPCTTSIFYKPSPKQTLATYKFFD